MSGRRKRNRRNKRWGPRLRIILVLLVPVMAVVFFAGVQIILALLNDIPKLDEENFLALGQTSRIYAADGSLLAEIYDSENRTLVPLETIPEDLKNAIVAVEDERFYRHSGLDYVAIARAAATDLSRGRLAEGGSTITQQLVKNVYVSGERSFNRKIVEAVLAVQLERITSKDEILERYLNTIYFGEGAYGVEVAAQTYFGKSVSELDLAESALLAGLPNLPSQFSPRRNITAAFERRNVVLQKMADLGMIDRDSATETASLPIYLKDTQTSINEPYFVEYVKDQLVEKYGAKLVFEGGLRIHTTIEPRLQEAGLKVINDTLNEEGDPAAALVAIDPANGFIKAMVSSQDFNQSQFNLAVQAKRQPGSTFKPILQTAATEAGVDPKKTFYMSKEIDIPVPGLDQPWHVATWDHKYYGVSNLEDAMVRSDNSVFAQLVMDVGPDKARDAAERLGIRSPLSANPSIALGGLGQGVSPLEMSSAYATLAANGLYAEPIAITKVEMPDGTVDYQANPQPEQVIDDGVAWTVTQVLKAVIDRGTTKASIGRPAAGKTGSTENLQDAWFVGYTPDLSTSVWIGYPDEQIPMTNVHGSQVWGSGFPATIWKNFMMEALKDLPQRDFDDPKKKPDFKKLVGQYVLFGGGTAPAPAPATTTPTTTTPSRGDRTTPATREPEDDAPPAFTVPGRGTRPR